MIDSDRAKFAALMEEHAAAFGVTLDPKRLNIYFDKLQKFEAEIVFKAIDDCHYSCPRFPAIHDIVSCYRAYRPIL